MAAMEVFTVLKLLSDFHKSKFWCVKVIRGKKIITSPHN